MNLFSETFRLYEKSAVITLIFAAFFLFVFNSAAQAQVSDADEDPTAIFNQAQDAHEKGDLETALKLYDQALKIEPEFPEAAYQRGIALLALKKDSEAETSFRRAIEIRPDWTLPMANLGALLVREGKYDQAENFLVKAVADDQPNFAAYSALTDLRLNTRAKPEILSNLLEKIKVLTGKANPSAAIWTSRGLLENRLGDLAAAKNSLRRAVELDPKNQTALVETASIAVSEGDLTAAREIFKKLSATAPAAAPVKLLEAQILLADGKNDEALKILDAIENPSPEVLTTRDKIKANTTANSAELEKQLEADPKNAAALGRLCTLTRIENPLKALEYCRRAFDVEPSNINHAANYGSALVQAKRYAEAAALFKKLLAIAPDNLTAHSQLGLALFELKQFADAETEFVWLTEKQPDSAIAYYFLAICRDQLTEYIDALASYQQFLKLADAEKNQLEIDKVNLRLPILQRQIKEKKGKKQ